MASPRLIVVIGATGTQGGSVVSALLENPSYRIRGVTRNASSEKAKALSAKGVEVVTADVNDIESLKKAFQGAHAIFANTSFVEIYMKTGEESAMQTEYQHGKNLADAAVSSISTLSHYIWSTLPSPSTISEGKYIVPHFESKARTDDYIIDSLPELAKKTTFLWIGFYGTNLMGGPTFAPFKIPSAGRYATLSPVPADTPIASAGLAEVNTGLFVASILSQPHLTRPAKYVFQRTETLAFGEMWKMLSKVMGTEVEYVHVSQDSYSRLWPGVGGELGVMLRFWDYAREKGWTKDGERVLTGEDLGVQGLVDQKGTFERQDWGAVFE